MLAARRVPVGQRFYASRCELPVLDQLRKAILLIVVAAFGLRLAYEVIAPTLPLLVVLAILLVIFNSLFTRHD